MWPWAWETETNLTLLALVPLLAVLCLPCPGALASGLVGNVSVGLGGKWRSEPTYWNQVRDEGIPEIAAEVFLGHQALPVSLTGYVARTRQAVESDTHWLVAFRQTNYEGGLGLAGVWTPGPLRAYLAAGLARISSKTEPTDLDTGSAFTLARNGHWIGAGAFFSFLGRFNVGATGRFTSVEAGYGSKLGGGSVGLALGWGWPGTR